MTHRKTKASQRRSQTNYAGIRDLLLQRREELVEQMNVGLDDSRADRVGARFDDVADRASDSLYSELAQGVAEIATADLHKIERALARIEEETYGRCEICGKTIPKARLRMLPFADLCVRCQQEVESEAAGARYGGVSNHGHN